MCSNSHTGGGRRECADDSEWRQIKSQPKSLTFSVRVIHSLSTGYSHPVDISELIHRLSTARESYPQVRSDLSTGYPQLIHKLSTKFIGDIFRNLSAWFPHLTPNSDSWIGKSRPIINSILCHTICWNWFAHVLTNWITPTVPTVHSHTLTHIALITHDCAYSHTSTRASSK